MTTRRAEGDVDTVEVGAVRSEQAGPAPGPEEIGGTQMRSRGVRTVALALAAVLVAASCGGDDGGGGSGGPEPTDANGDAPARPTGPVEVDRTSRFSQLDTFCEPAAEDPAEAPEATDPGITEDSISITHIRVTLEDLAGLGFAIPIGDPRDQAERFVSIVNERCGGIHGRILDLGLAEAPPVAPAGEDPSAVAQRACIEATEDHDAVFAFSGSGWGGQGGATCVTGDHDTIYLTTYNITPEDLERAENRLYSLALSPTEGLEYLARVLHADGLLDGKTIGVVMQDSPGDPEIVEEGLLDTLDELGVDVARVDAIGCGGGNSCSDGIIESVQGMIADGVDVMFPLLNVISLPGYINEMVTQGVQPGEVQFYNSGYHAQNGDLVSSKVVEFGGEDAGRLYDGTVIVSQAETGAFRMPDYEPPPFAEMCNREYQEAGGDTYSATDPDTNSAYGATTGMCTFIRIIARALEAAGPSPTRADLAAAVEGLGGIDLGGGIAGSWGPGKYTAPNQLFVTRFHFPCPDDMIPFGPGSCITPEGDAIPIPEVEGPEG